MRSITDILALVETSSNSDFLDSDNDDDDKGDTGFTKLQEMQHFLCIDDFVDRFDGHELSWP
jgi:hypothetical protein